MGRISIVLDLQESDFSYTDRNSDNLKQAQAEYSIFADVERTSRLFKRPNRINKF